MMPLFDMMLQAQNGTAMEAMAKQFGLAQEQTAKAMAALMPAFSSGLKRNATNPFDFSNLMSSMTSGNYGQYFEDLSKAFTPQGIADGNQVLAQLFGSKDVSRAIAAQAAQMTGIGQDVLKQMLPVMADTIMGGLFKQTTGQMAPANMFAGTPMGPMVQQWLEASGFAPKAPPKPEMNLFDNPFTRAFQDMMGQQQKPAPAAGNGNPFMDNPFAKAFQDMMAAGYGTKPPAETAKASAKPAEADLQKGMTDFVNAMFDSGLEVQKSYQKNMEQIFDTYLSNGKAGAEPPTNEPSPTDK